MAGGMLHLPIRCSLSVPSPVSPPGELHSSAVQGEADRRADCSSFLLRLAQSFPAKNSFSFKTHLHEKMYYFRRDENMNCNYTELLEWKLD